MKGFAKNTILFFTSIVFFFSCSNQFKTVSLLENDGKFPDESAREMEIIFSDSGRVNFIIYTPLLNKYVEEEYMDCPEGVKIISFDEYGNEQSVLTADYAISEDHKQVMEAHKNVVIKDIRKNEVIETEKIVWDKKRERIHSDVEVRQIKADGTINIGDGFDADDRFSKYSIRNPRGEVLADDL